MIDFTTLKGLTVPEGVVVQISDASGNAIWALEHDEPIVLEVEKITSNTYVSSTSYTNEEFILLDIYPQSSSSTVRVTYGDLTKTLSFSSIALQQLYFGTYGGVSDEVETPSSGTLTIEGGYVGVGCGSYSTAKTSTHSCSCITAITNFGEINTVPSLAFRDCTSLTNASIPNGVVDIGLGAFNGCTSLTSVSIPNSVTTMGHQAFDNCSSLAGVYITDLAAWCNIKFQSEFSNPLSYAKKLYLNEEFVPSITIPGSVTSIGSYAFHNCSNLTSVAIPDSVASIGSDAFSGCSNLTNVALLRATPPTLEYSAFDDCPVTITVPAGCGDTYKAADGWSDYADYIVEAS